MINELDLVVLARDVPNEHLEAGDVGTIVAIYSDPPGYEVEFTSFTGDAISLVTLPAAHVRPIDAREVPHARRIVHS